MFNYELELMSTNYNNFKVIPLSMNTNYHDKSTKL